MKRTMSNTLRALMEKVTNTEQMGNVRHEIEIKRNDRNEKKHNRKIEWISGELMLMQHNQET